MDRSKISRAVLVLLVALLVVLMVGCSQASDDDAMTSTQDEISTDADVSTEGAAVVEDKCTGCHSSMRIRMPSYVNEPAGGLDWADVVERMEETHGAVLTDDEVATIVDYLVTRGDSETAALVRVKCGSCHELHRIYDADAGDAQWAQIVTRMQEEHELVLTEDEQSEIVDFFEGN